MKQRVSSSTQRGPLTMICAVDRVPRSSVYAIAIAVEPPAAGRKPGPKTRHSDADVVEALHAVLAACPFHGEGYRKVRARLAHRGLRLGGKRVLRLMRGHALLAPRRLGPSNGDPAHAGTITTTRPDKMWGTDATRFYTEQDGWCWFFGAIDRAGSSSRATRSHISMGVTTMRSKISACNGFAAVPPRCASTLSRADGDGRARES